MITDLIQRKPVVFLGNYLKSVRCLLSEDYYELLIPKVIWIEYRAIPLIELAKILHNQSNLMDQFYFLELTTLDTLEQLLKSSELFSVAQHGFSTLIIDIPQCCFLPYDTQIRFRELAKHINVILIMDQLSLSRSQIKLIQVDYRK